MITNVFEEIKGLGVEPTVIRLDKVWRIVLQRGDSSLKSQDTKGYGDATPLKKFRRSGG